MERLHRYEPICRARFPTGLRESRSVEQIVQENLGASLRHIQALGEW